MLPDDDPYGSKHVGVKSATKVTHFLVQGHAAAIWGSQVINVVTFSDVKQVYNALPRYQTLRLQGRVYRREIR